MGVKSAINQHRSASRLAKLPVLRDCFVIPKCVIFQDIGKEGQTGNDLSRLDPIFGFPLSP